MQLLLVRVPCPQYQMELDRVKQTEEMKAKFSKYSQLFGNLTQITGQQIDDFEGVLDIHGTLKAEVGWRKVSKFVSLWFSVLQQNCNLTLPEWTEDYYPGKILNASIFSYVLNVYTDKLKRLKGGIFFSVQLSNLTQNNWSSFHNITNFNF